MLIKVLPLLAPSLSPEPLRGEKQNTPLPINMGRTLIGQQWRAKFPSATVYAETRSTGKHAALEEMGFTPTLRGSRSEGIARCRNVVFCAAPSGEWIKREYSAAVLNSALIFLGRLDELWVCCIVALDFFFFPPTGFSVSPASLKNFAPNTWASSPSADRLRLYMSHFGFGTVVLSKDNTRVCMDSWMLSIYE